VLESATGKPDSGVTGTSLKIRRFFVFPPVGFLEDKERGIKKVNGEIFTEQLFYGIALAQEKAEKDKLAILLATVKKSSKGYVAIFMFEPIPVKLTSRR